jgi:hypothetical protein
MFQNILLLGFHAFFNAITAISLDYSYTTLSGIPNFFYSQSVYYDDAAAVVYICGFSADGFTYFNDGKSDSYITKHHAANGSRIWLKMLNFPESQMFYKLAPDQQSSGDIFVAGESWSALTGQTYNGVSDCIILRYATNGTLLLLKQFGTASGDTIRDLHIASGIIYSTGEYNGKISVMVNSAVNGSLLRAYQTTGDGLAEGIAPADTIQSTDFFVSASASSTTNGVNVQGGKDILL